MSTAAATPAPLSLLNPLELITPTRQLRTLSRAEIAFLITQGHILVLHRTYVYRLNKWLRNHPGGDLPVLHFVGRDATDEIEAYHPLFAVKAMKHYMVAQVAAEDWQGEEVVGGIGFKNLQPPVHLGWPIKAVDYEGVATLDDSLALLELYKTTGFPTAAQAVSPIGTSLPFLSVEELEPPAPPASIDLVEQRRLNISFRKLRNELLAEEGLFEMRPFAYYKWTLLRCSLLFISFLYFFSIATQGWQYGISAVSLGAWMHQIMFCAHDAGHTGITGNRWTDRAIGATIASFASGISIGWWVDQHDVHHLIPNHPEHDPDIQLMPFFAFSPRFFNNIYSTFHRTTLKFDAQTKFLLQYQHLLFYPVMVFARFSLLGKSYYYLLMKAKPDGFRNYEMAGVVFFWLWYGVLLFNMGVEGATTANWITRLVYTLIVLLTVCPIHVQIVLSHSTQSNEDVGVHEGFVHRQMRTTMDVSCPAYLDFIHGGLQMQISHHLFPRLSRPQLRRATVKVKAWAIENKIEFREKSFVEGNDQMISMLGEIAGQVRALMDTADKQARGLIHDH